MADINPVLVVECNSSVQILFVGIVLLDGKLLVQISLVDGIPALEHVLVAQCTYADYHFWATMCNLDDGVPLCHALELASVYFGYRNFRVIPAKYEMSIQQHEIQQGYV